MSEVTADPFAPGDDFPRRHLGSNAEEVAEMLAAVGCASLDELADETVPRAIRQQGELVLPAAEGLPAGRPPGERETAAALAAMAADNEVYRSYLGMGYHGTVTPAVIQRNILENPGWYTQYTPYQAEISQGRLEALLNFQTLIEDLTGLPVANASLLDEGTAAAEAMSLCLALAKREKSGGAFFVADHCHPQTIAVVETRAESIGLPVVVGDAATADLSDCFGALFQYPTSDGRVLDLEPWIARAHEAGARAVVAADPLALALLRPPGEMGADVAIGSAQRFGVPMGYGGPHAAYMATREEYKRQIPGRLIGVSRDAQGDQALRMALQTREQHIRREKATSNICTAQVLLAIMAGMYAVYHGPRGLERIAERVHHMTAALAEGLGRLGFELGDDPYFDTLRVGLAGAAADDLVAAARERRINLRRLDDGAVGVSLDETVGAAEIEELLAVFSDFASPASRESTDQDGELEVAGLAAAADTSFPAPHARTSDYLTHPVFNSFHTEHEMLRYLRRLESRDLSLAHSMIPLGS
ncbi:MAG TPA: glycine dehydrogenase (aminomethyl-transferring), partial [Thermoanaerobaculia bacterium]|nr:glycine dehydrogenase (aminomethyl-transferring) [Thermoanaerobaculia bacterium]